MTGIALYLALTVAAATAVALGRPVPGADAQRRMKGLLSLGALYLAAAVAFGGWTAIGRKWWQSLSLVAVSLILGNCVGVLARFQKGSNLLGRRAGAWLGPDVPAPRFCGGLVLVLGMNPVGWLAGLLAGLTGDWRPLVFKGVLDGLGVWSTAAGRPASAALAAAGVAAFQLALLWVGELLRVRFDGTDVAGLFGLTAGVYLALLPPVLLGITRVPLANLFLALPTIIVLGRWWH